MKALKLSVVVVLITGIGVLLSTLIERTDVSRYSSSAKVTICHKGKTIKVSPASVRAHLVHGDTKGVCP